MAKDFRANLQSAYIPHDPVDQEVGGPSMTRQEFSEECDVNALMARYDKVGGVLPPPNNMEPLYLDLTALPTDYMSAMNAMIDAENAFMTLPAKVRAEFENNPAAFVNFALDKANLDQLRTWGLAPPLAIADAPMKVEVVKMAGAQPAVGPASAPADKPTQ